MEFLNRIPRFFWLCGLSCNAHIVWAFLDSNALEGQVGGVDTFWAKA